MYILVVEGWELSRFLTGSIYMNSMLTLLIDSLRLIKNDKLIILYSLVPILLGFVLNIYFGSTLYILGVETIKENITLFFAGQNSILIQALMWLLVLIFTVLFWILLNWMMILTITILAAPFNDLISSRVEYLHYSRRASSSGEGLGVFSRIVDILINEIKKILLIVLLSVVSFLLNLIPLLMPLSLLLMAFLVSFNFLDYSFSRHNWTASQCIGFFRKKFFSNAISGFVFLSLLSVPILNLFLVPLAVVFYTKLFLTQEHNLPQPKELLS